jgi:aminoglycoside phosphotransferase family enzyme/predicted kinase
MTNEQAVHAIPVASHVVADQSEALQFLGFAHTHGLAAPATRIDTHGAVVFLAGDSAYKVKRAVRFPFMDLSTLAKRRAACEAEVTVNRPGAPSIYLGTVPITRSKDGLELGGTGEPIEWAVCMRRFDERQTLDQVAERGELSDGLLAKLVRAILAAHARAPLRPGLPATESLRRYVRQNRDAFAESAGLFPRDRAEALTASAQNQLEKRRELLLDRGRAGFVRRCHGDLHLRNIVLLGGEPTLFDAVEFDDAIATGDVLYDLAFLLMDLWERGLKAAANLVLNRYLWGSDTAQIRGLASLPLFLSLRAAIRAKVIAASLPHLSGSAHDTGLADAREYFAAAERFLEPSAARVVAIGGLSGSGKTTLSRAVAPYIGRPPGAVHLRSDIERKVMAGVDETDRLPASAYTEAATEAVYASLKQKAKLVLAAGQSVVVDAVHAKLVEREAIEGTAASAGVRFSGLWLEAPTEILIERVTQRTGDASDATEAVVQLQAAYELGSMRWTRLNTASNTRDQALNALGIPPSTIYTRRGNLNDPPAPPATSPSAHGHARRNDGKARQQHAGPRPR